MTDDLLPIRFRGGNDEPGSKEWNGFYAGQGFVGIEVWVEASTLLDIISDDLLRHGSDLRDWAPMLGMLEQEDYSIEVASGDRLYRLADCYFVAVEPVIPHWAETPRLRYAAVEPTPTNTDPHIIDRDTGEIVEDLLTMAEALGRAAELNRA